mmetsp:Transcript_8235/g.12893  ORF Transcript_8235/g.12893 Transcript_8235/m.12893 type:complete len:107 (+) Transcript_8235:84-404(+)|eukprot:CAMPEP_0201724748 /NCGR_PEP_ID=MMETSP0593-20130828/8390_1 /ASSEMBLY_ACC=CAM_ASM_000672 /TAXON_ID=267983 /ORGANISM="Skeletonema japonicum, Strain CCMP2506" /LENGTH=106 /DNA_ID=CAMNT_0048216049 /DNA_START=70 /DNA_END=390 /DNA_ORIENTATION=-
MSNPITTWIKSGMETYKDREDWMTERLSENSINSQKLVDERHGPFKPHDVYQCENRAQVNFRPSFAISSLANSEIGCAGSFRAVRAYQSDFAKRRDEILTDIAKNG